MNDGTDVIGRAITTKTAPEKIEYLTLDSNNQFIDVPMHEIAKMITLE